MPNPVYPTLPIAKDGSKRVSRDGRKTDTAGDGSGRVRKLHDDKSDFELKHENLSTTDMATIVAFYAANANAAAIDFTWIEDGVTYTVRFDENAFSTAPGSAYPARHAFVRLVAT